MRRFLINPDEDDSIIMLAADESHHISRVLRLNPGEEIELFDGTGALYRAAIENSGKQVSVRILSKKHIEPAGKIPLWLYQGDLKSKKMDLLVQKSTELGVERFVPFTSSRSQGRLNRERRERTRERWQKLMVAACKQSKRLRFLELGHEVSFSSVINDNTDLSPTLKLLCWEEERNRDFGQIDWQQQVEKVCLMLGPEGGLSSDEVEQARLSGWQTISLGRLILRAETAAIASIAIVQHLLKNM